jgi:nicotinamidase-related amidase
VPLDLTAVLAPGHTAVVTVEIQRGVVGDLSFSPALAEAAARVGLVPNSARLVRAARAAGVRVVHAVAQLRADRAGLSVNNRMMASIVKNPDQVTEGSPYAEVVPELGPEPEDIVCARIHGLTPFTGTELDSILRNLEVTTIVAVGVSVNIGVLGLCLTASDLGYNIVLPRDGVAGIPHEYADAVLEHTLAFLATITTVDAVLDAWRA